MKASSLVPSVFAVVAVLGSVGACQLDELGTGELLAGTGGAEVDAADELADDQGGMGGIGGGAGSAGYAGLDASEEDAEQEHEACAPVTCEDLSAACGTYDDHCGAQIACGDCPGAQGCHDFRCVVVHFVKPLGAGAQDGTSWDDAFPSVQAALTVAQVGDEIWVAEGTYYKTAPGLPVVRLTQGAAVYGGFAGTEQNRLERDLLANHTTVLDGANADRVVEGASNALLDGITIRSAWVGDSGAGLKLFQTQGMRVVDCSFEDNFAGVHGAAIYAFQSTFNVVRSLFRNNEATQGGGIFSDQSTVSIDSSVFHGNSAVNNAGGGGALFNHYGGATVINTVFSANTSSPYYAGAVYNLGDYPMRYVNCTFHENAADMYGGAIFNNVGAKPLIANSILWGNSPEQIYDWPGAGPADVQYSDVQSGATGTGNIDEPPLFEDPLSGRLGLASGSPCIDAADGDQAPTLDALGASRVDDPATPNTGVGALPPADMGAFEYQPQ